MAKHIYDKDGNYKGKILSESEHRDNRSSSRSIPDCFFCGSSVYDRNLYRGKNICSTCKKKPNEVKDKRIKRSKESFRILWIRSVILVVVLFVTEKYGITNLDYFGDISGWMVLIIIIIWIFTCLLPALSRSSGIPFKVLIFGEKDEKKK